MNINNIIDSGILEAYCLGTLPDFEARKITDLAAENPELSQMIDDILVVLSKVDNNSLNPELKPKVLNHLDQFFKDTIIDLKNPPLIDKNSDAKAWKMATNHIIEPKGSEDLEVFPIINTKSIELNLVWLRTELLEEAHPEEDFKESFLILEGECECDFGGMIVRFKSGDYFEVPANTKHRITNCTKDNGVIKGLVQRLAS